MGSTAVPIERCGRGCIQWARTRLGSIRSAACTARCRAVSGVPVLRSTHQAAIVVADAPASAKHCNCFDEFTGARQTLDQDAIDG